MNFKKLIGKTLIHIEGMYDGSEEVKLHCSDGTLFTLYHPQDCCEQVELYDVCGDVDDLLNTPIIVADETTNTTDAAVEDWHDSWTWTLYKLATVKGWVDLRWYGSSNGYYSEEVETRIEAYDDRVAEIRHEYGRNRITAEERDNLIRCLRTDYERLLI